MLLSNWHRWLLSADSVSFAFTFAEISFAKSLNRTDTIRKKLAFLLLLVFALSTAPKILFHEALADHKDGLVCQDADKSVPHFHQPSFHCSFDDLVVSSPYISVELKGAPDELVFFLREPSGLTTSTFSSFLLQQESRGPPVAWGFVHLLLYCLFLHLIVAFFWFNK